jgi:hypothetical protein
LTNALPTGLVEARPEIVPLVQGNNASNIRDQVRPVRTDDKRIFEVQRNNGGGVMKMDRKLRLQINMRGAWKDLLQFRPERRADMLRAAKLFGGILGGDIKWCIVAEDGRRQRLPNMRGPWLPITGGYPEPLKDVMVTVYDANERENVVYMAYRKQANSSDFYLSGTFDQVLHNAYAWTEVIAPAPARQVAA